jgi:hypothetical protein
MEADAQTAFLGQPNEPFGLVVGQLCKNQSVQRVA